MNLVSAAVVLTVIFTVLKLAGVIAWSWVWVLSPLWVGLLAVVIMLIVLIIFALLMGALIR